jgi:NADH:ubiquinone oxidoreductase subunit 6 (subunit J)
MVSVGNASSRLINRLVQVFVGSIFVAFISVVIVFAGNGWTWPSEINGVALNLPEFVALLIFLAFIIGVCIDYWRMKQKSNVKVNRK